MDKRKSVKLYVTFLFGFIAAAIVAIIVVVCYCHIHTNVKLKSDGEPQAQTVVNTEVPDHSDKAKSGDKVIQVARQNEDAIKAKLKEQGIDTFDFDSYIYASYQQVIWQIPREGKADLQLVFISNSSYTGMQEILCNDLGAGDAQEITTESN